MKKFCLALLCALGVFAAAAPAVTNFEVARYLGKWYELARYPNWFERGMNNVTAEYTLLPDGRIQVRNSGWRNGKLHTATGIAKYNGYPDRGEFLISFMRPFYHEYRIILLNQDYTLAVVTNKNMKRLWILSRKKELPPETWQMLFKFLKHNGFDINKLIF
ncbi:MAG: lipocalin family protein [Lentisphaeria bacterium]|nr:lipocalin family protein [Lentisphaeria bacterium]